MGSKGLVTVANVCQHKLLDDGIYVFMPFGCLLVYKYLVAIIYLIYLNSIKLFMGNQTKGMRLLHILHRIHIWIHHDFHTCWNRFMDFFTCHVTIGAISKPRPLEPVPVGRCCFCWYVLAIINTYKRTYLAKMLQIPNKTVLVLISFFMTPTFMVADNFVANKHWIVRCKKWIEGGRCP